MIARSAAAACLLSLCPSCAGSTPPPEVPEVPVALQLHLTGGRSLNLGALRGRDVVVAILQTSAAPALLLAPRLVKIAREHVREGLTVVGIVAGETPDMVKIFADQFGIPFPIGWVDDAASMVSRDGPFGPIRVIPTTIFLNRSGEIVLRLDGEWPPGALEAAVDRLLSSDRPASPAP